MMLFNQKWQAQETEILRMMKARGETAEMIAAVLGRTLRAVEHKASHLGCKVPERWPNSKASKLRKLRGRKRSFGQIAAELGISRSAVAGRVWREKRRKEQERASA